MMGMVKRIETDDTRYLAEFLEQMQWSQTEAAKQLGITRLAFGNYYRGVRQDGIPSSLPDTVKLACEALKRGVRLG